MKNSDIAMVILVSFVSVVVSYLLGNAIMGDPNDRVETIQYMTPISNTIEQPDIETFNPHALNPTVEVYVGNCGPLEVWSESKHICVPREGFEDEDDAVVVEDGTSDNDVTTGDE